ncbi:hypothetical protein B0J12DRAFT_740303 [Macrophomina phaseolina]|uniref:Uncharacterized protein n=1 Tax=Macrophomina phaseolina TaxID=35725 RepID=A0ABQ8GA84_9PEZI|nr:hypothetical protein B0J12DRAFT_740303 [Macrophomina phaseolina]
MQFTKATILAFAALLAQGYAADFESCYNSVKDCTSISSSACEAMARGCCEEANSACRVGPDANMSYCSSQNSICYAKNGIPDPYGINTQPQPTEKPDFESCYNSMKDCPSVSSSACEAMARGCCEEADSACRVGPDANMSYCSSQKSTCYSKNGLPDPYQN